MPLYSGSDYGGQVLNFPASVALPNNTTVQLTPAIVAGGDDLVEIVNTNLVAFKRAGVYTVHGELITATSVNSNQSVTMLRMLTQAGAAPNAADLVGNKALSYGMFYHNSVGRYQSTFIVRDPSRIGLRFEALQYTGGSVNVWTNPGTIEIVKVR